MRIAVIGATGLLGTGIVPEAAARGHAVLAICRHPEQIPSHDNVTPVACDVHDIPRLADHLRGADAVIFAYSPRHDHVSARTEPHVAATRAMLQAMRDAGARRLLAAGGAGTLRLPDGSKVMDAPDFPEAYRESAISTAAMLDIVRAEAGELEWTVLCPSLFFAECGRTGSFRLGLDDALFDTNGKSSISIEDYAIAMVDECEQPGHSRQRFTVGY